LFDRTGIEAVSGAFIHGSPMGKSAPRKASAARAGDTHRDATDRAGRIIAIIAIVALVAALVVASF